MFNYFSKICCISIETPKAIQALLNSQDIVKLTHHKIPMKVYFTDNMISSPYHTENKAEQLWDCKRSVTLMLSL